ncbi:ABC transporter permease [Trujillonella endophytica]|uniref:Transport permease protein n=1 Tax=Trujillonella endophytica TaxID=673521 RepID=A0A1H8VJR9_9ACTN|nr:ABC transporter permease [Trujillella endophytica]SEP15573.1 ABC transporter efflux protein, DrrB family [Trujillella endophytica]
MTATEIAPAPRRIRPEISPPTLLRASATIVWRNLVHIRRMPEMLLDVTVQSVMFVLLFAYVFGGAIAVAGTDYKEFLLPGIMVQTMVFSAAIVAMGLTSDLQKGIVDRFKSLPIPRSAVLVGRSISSLIHSSIGVAVMAVTGLLIGWRMRNGLLDAALAFLLLLLFGFAVIWLGIWVGSLMRTVEAVQGFMFTVMFPLTFVANTFAPPESMPSWLRAIAEWNPVSAVTQACRELWGNGLPASADAAWPLQHPVLMSIAWSLVLTAVFAPLAVSAFRRRSRD